MTLRRPKNDAHGCLLWLLIAIAAWAVIFGGIGLILTMRANA